ncbi:MAG: hypothetical protein JRN52_06810 [Nitrososphaerota archaeon]|nr:hypothetical protein [Nitrososphaerota archaeon]
MAVARLDHVVLLCPKSELQTLLVRLSEFGQYHPLEKDGLVQSIELLILSSKAQGIYSDASHLLPENYLSETVSSGTGIITFDSKDPEHLIQLLSSELINLQSNVAKSDPSSRRNIYRKIEAIREAALSTFNNLRRVRFSFESKRTYILEGYIPTKEANRFAELLGEFLISYEPVGKDEANEPYVPTLFSNRRGISLFENVTLVKGFPRYNEIDPTPVTAVVFPLFFGIMFSDLGQGIVLFLFGYLLARMFRGNYNYWGKLLMVLGSASAVIGLLRGLFFGFEFESPLRLFGSSHFPAVLAGGFSIASVIVWLEVSIIVGTFHLVTGYWMSLLNRLRSNDYAEAFLSGLPTILLYSSAVPLTLALAGTNLEFGSLLTNRTPTPFFNELFGVNLPVYLVTEVSLPIFLVSLCVLVIGRAVISYETNRGRLRMLRSVAMGLLDGLVKPFEFFMNTISYLRLGILLVLGTILATLSNEALGLGLIGIFAAVIGNIAVMAIEALMVYIQDLRLHAYEWLSNFYSGSGIPFEAITSKGLNFSIRWKTNP